MNQAHSKLYAEHGDQDIVVGDAIYIPNKMPSPRNGTVKIIIHN